MIQKSASNLTELMQQVLNKAKAKGASDAMVSFSQEQGFSVSVRLGQVESVTFNEDKELSVVIYHGHKKGSASSTDTSPDAIETLIQAASDIAAISASDPCFGLPDKALMQQDYPGLDLFHPWNITPNQAIETLIDCEAQALRLDKRLHNSDGAHLSTHTFIQGFANTHGGSGVLQGSQHSIHCSLIAKQGETMQKNYDYTTSRVPEQLLDCATLAKNAANNTLNRLGARPLKTQKASVLFSPRVSSSLVSHLISAISGANLYRKNSFLVDSLGQQIFPAGFHLHEQPYLLQGLGSSPFDGEGVPTRNNVFVNDGIIQQYALGSYAARRMGLTTTANSGGTHNLTLDPTLDQGLDYLLKQMHTGLLVTELLGQGVNGLTGDYSRGAAGFWVEGGEIQFPVEEITIASNLKDMYRRILAVGNDINPNKSTRCGSVLLEEMTIAGQS